MANPYHTEVVAGIEDALDAADMSALIGHGRRDTDRLEAQLERMLDLRVDAVIVVSSWIRTEPLLAAAAQIPVMVVGRLEGPRPAWTPSPTTTRSACAWPPST